MSSFTELSFTELAQKLVDIQETEKENLDKQTDPIMAHLHYRYSEQAVLKQEVSELQKSIAALTEQYQTDHKGNREKIIKKIVLMKIEILTKAILENEGNSRITKDKAKKNRKEYNQIQKEMIEKIVNVSGNLLSIAITGTAYYPFVIKLANLLHLLSLGTDSFIPILYYPLYMMSQLVKCNISNTAPLQTIPKHAVKVGERYINTKVFSEHIMNNSLDLIGHCLRQYSNSLAFPEYAAYTVAELKRIRNNPQNKGSSWINRKIEGIIKAAKEHSESIERIRVGLSAFNLETVKRLEEKIPELQLKIE